MSDRKYLRDVLPKLYRETEEWLRKVDRQDLLEQLPHLYITGRCDCGWCSDFHMDSDIPKLSREQGSVLLYRPLFYPMENGFMLGLTGAEGLTVGEHTESYISGYELSGGDYCDDYIHQQLEAHGFIRPKPRKSKRTRLTYEQKYRQKMKFRGRQLRKTKKRRRLEKVR